MDVGLASGDVLSVSDASQDLGEAWMQTLEVRAGVSKGEGGKERTAFSKIVGHVNPSSTSQPFADVCKIS